MLHLIVVGKPGELNNDLIAKQIEAHPNDGVVMRRCDSVGALLALVRGVRAEHEEAPIDVLDIVDHAAPGKQELGNGVLFEATRTPGAVQGEDLASQLGVNLTNTGQMRLLGCSTGSSAGERGQLAKKLMFRLALALGERRVVLGTLRPTTAADFQTGILLPRLEETILFSSHTAPDVELPPTAETRQADVATLLSL